MGENQVNQSGEACSLPTARIPTGVGPGCAHPIGELVGAFGPDDTASDLHRSKRAGDGNRTRMTSLEGWGSAIELRPPDRATAGPPSVGYRSGRPDAPAKPAETGTVRLLCHLLTTRPPAGATGGIDGPI